MRLLTVVCFLSCGGLLHPARAQGTPDPAASSIAPTAQLDCIARRAADVQGSGTTTTIDAARLQPGNRMPGVQAGEPRRFTVSIVVDTLGRTDLATLKVLTPLDSATTHAVRTVLPAWRFSPARVGGCPVKQVVRLTFSR